MKVEALAVEVGWRKEVRRKSARQAVVKSAAQAGKQASTAAFGLAVGGSGTTFTKQRGASTERARDGDELCVMPRAGLAWLGPVGRQLL